LPRHQSWKDILMFIAVDFFFEEGGEKEG